MAEIVTLREKSDNELRELLEEGMEEMFNLRFQRASGQLKDTSRVRKIRRDLAQVKTVLRERERAIAAASQEPAIAAVLDGKQWAAAARFEYEETAWRVTFEDGSGNELATAQVNLNKRQDYSRRDRRELAPPELVRSYEIAG